MPAATSAVGNGAGRVLIVDDDPQLRRLCDLAFSLQGFEAVEVHNGLQALEKAVESQPTVAVVDLWLPGLDGFGVIRRLKSDARTANIPVLAITGHQSADLRERAQRAGADALLLKPLTPDNLTATAQLLIERAALLRDLAARQRSRAANLIEKSAALQARSAPHIARPRVVRCRFCGNQETSLARETDHTWLFSCDKCHKQWRRAKQ
jgi:two-component system, cell cycle response regulator DivK